MPLLLGNWKLIAVGFFLLAVFSIIGVQRHQIKSLKQDVIDRTVERDQALASYNLLAQQTVKQNAAINDLADKAKQAQIQADKSRKKSKQVVDRSKSIVDAATARPFAASCDDAVTKAQEDLKK